MENIENDEGLSLSELFHIIFNRKWLLLIITAVITLIGTLGIVLIINNKKEKYTADFTISFPTNNNVYPDGTRFNYLDMISYDNLKEVKDSNATFKNINIQDMYEKNHITIANTSNDTDETNKYSISVKGKYFSSEAQAKKFITALTNQPINYIVNTVKTSGYKANLEVYEKAITYESQINALINQRDYLISNYNSLINNNFSLFSVNNKTITEYLNEINLFFKENNIDSLSTELEIYGYVKDDSIKDTYRLKMEELDKEYTKNEETIKSLQNKISELQNLYKDASLLSTFESFNQKIADLTVRNTEILIEKDNLQKYIDGTKNPAFEQKLNDFYNKINKFSEDYHNVELSVYESNSKVIYHTGSIIVSSGTINVILATLISLIIGLVIGSIVILIMDLPKYKKRKQENLNIINEKE